MKADIYFFEERTAAGMMLTKEGLKMKISCLDDEPPALKMLETCVKQAKPEAEVLAFDDQDMKSEFIPLYIP